MFATLDVLKDDSNQNQKRGGHHILFWVSDEQIREFRTLNKDWWTPCSFQPTGQAGSTFGN